ncbi:MAG: hypothetical protein IKL79_06155 [Clostridia bacterium]|nr:hypothetical protein [Clostridia bacterium]
MKTLLCNACGGALERIEDNTFICSYCGTKQILTQSEDKPKKQEHIFSVADKYAAACYAMSSANSSHDFIIASRLFSEIKWYRDSDTLAASCIKKAKDFRNDEIYRRAKELMQENVPHFLSQAAELFGQIPDWRNSNELKETCQERVANFNREISIRNESVKKLQSKKRKRKNFIWAVIILTITAAYLISAILLAL